MGKEFWDQRYATREYAYGKEPNLFFREQIDKLEPGKLLLAGEGEGRNAVYAAKLGWKVTAFDFSKEGQKKAQRLADANDVKIQYIVDDFDTMKLPENEFDAVGMFFLHLTPDFREKNHAKLVKSLKTGGKLIAESFSKEQIKLNSGGPKNITMLYSEEELKNDFSDLRIELCMEIMRQLSEGSFHSGKAWVIRFLATK